VLSLNHPLTLFPGYSVPNSGQPAVRGCCDDTCGDLGPVPAAGLAAVRLQGADQHGHADTAAADRAAGHDPVLHRGLADPQRALLLLDLLAVRPVPGAHPDRLGGLLRDLQQAEEPHHRGGRAGGLRPAEGGARQADEADQLPACSGRNKSPTTNKSQK